MTEQEIPVEFVNFGLFPNPSNEAVTIEVPMTKDAEATVSLLDVTGRAVEAQTRQISKGDNLFSFQTGRLVEGLYFVQVRQGELTATRKLVVQH